MKKILKVLFWVAIILVVGILSSHGFDTKIQDIMNSPVISEIKTLLTLIGMLIVTLAIIRFNIFYFFGS